MEKDEREGRRRVQGFYKWCVHTFSLDAPRRMVNVSHLHPGDGSPRSSTVVGLECNSNRNKELCQNCAGADKEASVAIGWSATP